MRNAMKNYGSALLGALLALCLMSSCSLQTRESGHLCGSGEAAEALNGLFWLLGEPGQANVLCQVHEKTFQQVMVLEPDSQDPILFQDDKTGNVLLVERFSGSAARPSRATWFRSNGAQRSQWGDWPQNTYGVLRLSDTEGLATGFDLAQLNRIQMSGADDSSLGKSFAEPVSFSDFQPIVTLTNGSWLALVDSGFDLTRFEAQTAKAMTVRASDLTSEAPRSVSDPITKQECKNAFQTQLISPSKVVLSCNPQYFGPVANELVSVFEVELLSTGELKFHSLFAADGRDIQKVDLLGVSGQNEVLMATMQTTPDDYKGRFVQVGFLSLTDAQFVEFSAARGPVALTQAGRRVFYCQEASERCEQGEFYVAGTPQGGGSSVNPNFTRPFLSFAARIPSP